MVNIFVSTYSLYALQIIIEEAKKKGYSEESYRKIVTYKKEKRNINEQNWQIEPPSHFPKTSSGIVLNCSVLF